MGRRSDGTKATLQTDLADSAAPPGAHRLARGAFLVIALLYLVLLGVASLSRTRHFSPDSMNYVDVSRNILAGRGISQSTFGFNQPHFDLDGTIPTPMVSQPPLYPLLIAALSLPGIEAADASLIVPVLAYGIILLLGYLLVSTPEAEGVGLLAAAFLMLYQPLRAASSYAWSETLGIAFVLLSFWLLERTGPRSTPPLSALLAGICAGLAFVTRYALLPALGLELLALLDPRQALRAMRRLGVLLLGFAVPAVPVLVRNLALSGTLLGPSANPSTRGLSDNLRDAWWALTGNILPISELSSQTQMVLLGLTLVACCVILAVRHRLSAAIQAILTDRRSLLLIFWFLVYTAALVYQRTQTHFDPLDSRLTLPAGVAILLLLAVLVGNAVGSRSAVLVVPALLLGLVAVGLEANDIATNPPYDVKEVIARSQRLTWIDQHTSDRDLIIGDDTMDIPFYFPGRKAISFSPYPYTDWPVYRWLASYVDRHCGEYAHVYLVVRGGSYPYQGWKNAYGPFIADVVTGRINQYPAVALRQTLTDAFIFDFSCTPRT